METSIVPATQSMPVAGYENYLDVGKYEQLVRVAQVFAKSQLVPKHFQGKHEDCFIAMQMAMRLKVDPLMCIQNMVVIQGTPAFKTQFAIALANQSGLFSGVMTYSCEGEGDKLVVTAEATIAKTGQVVTASVSMAMAKAEGWTRNAKYKTMPEHMLTFRSAMFLIRRYCPHVLLGMQSSDEVEAVNYRAPRQAPKKLADQSRPVAVIEEPVVVETEVKEVEKPVEKDQNMDLITRTAAMMVEAERDIEMPQAELCAEYALIKAMQAQIFNAPIIHKKYNECKTSIQNGNQAAVVMQLEKWRKEKVEVNPDQLEF